VIFFMHKLQGRHCPASPSHAMDSAAPRARLGKPSGRRSSRGTIGNLAPAFAQAISHYRRWSPGRILAIAYWKALSSDKNQGLTRIVEALSVHSAFLYPFYSNCWTIYARNVSHQQSLCLIRSPMVGNRSFGRANRCFLRVRRDSPAGHLCACCCAVIAFGLLRATGSIEIPVPAGRN
jgi:hypothetical protein